MAYTLRGTVGQRARQPYSLSGVSTANQALQRWLAQQRQARGQFTAAAQPLEEAVEMFQPGGGYGAGQRGLLTERARQTKAEALSRQVASGISSGSLATGTGLRIERDLTQGLAGAEDVRTQFLTQALGALSGLRGQQAQTTATVTDPTYASFMPYLSNIASISAQSQQARAQRRLDETLARLKARQPQQRTQAVSGRATPRY